METFKQSIDYHLSQLNKAELNYVTQETGKVLFQNLQMPLTETPQETGIWYGIMKLIQDLFPENKSTLVNYLFTNAMMRMQ
jgi:hypothetical protein